MNAYRSISLACALAAAWLAGCNRQPEPSTAALETAAPRTRTQADEAPRTMLIAGSTDERLIATEPLTRLDSGVRGEGIRPTRGASGLQP